MLPVHHFILKGVILTFNQDFLFAERIQRKEGGGVFLISLFKAEGENIEILPPLRCIFLYQLQCQNVNAIRGTTDSGVCHLLA